MTATSSIRPTTTDATAAKIPSNRASVSIPEINKRAATAAQIEKIFGGIQPGQKLQNAAEYLDKLKIIDQATAQDYAKLYNPNIKVTESVQKAREALQKQISVLERVLALAQSANILPAAKKPTEQGLPWEGQLREGETPLHWAVRNHDHRTTLLVRYHTRQTRLAAICQHYAGTVKNTKIAAILKKPDILPKLLLAIEVAHVLNLQNFDSKSLQARFKDPDIIKILQDPDFRKIFQDSQAHLILNGLDILRDQDSKGLSPLDEAILQNDQEMVRCLLFPHLAANEQLQAMFWNKIENLQSRIAEMRHVDLNKLSAEGSKAAFLCQAAYVGDIDQLEMENDYRTIKDQKGLTPLHYAILGGQIEAVQYLLSRSDPYTLTPQGHTYFDYAILSGHVGLCNRFQQYKLPFKLGTEQERFIYLLASGVLDQQLTLSAEAKDPLNHGFMDMIFGGINATWAGMHLFNHAFNQAVGTPIPGGAADWVGWSGKQLEKVAFHTNEYLNFPRIFNALPTPVASIARTGLLVNSLGIPLVVGTARLLGLTEYQWPGALDFISNKGIRLDPWYLATGYACLSVWSAVKPVLNKLPAYRDNFTSRPTVVMKKLALDVFNISAQATMNYLSWSTTIASILKPPQP